MQSSSDNTVQDFFEDCRSPRRRVIDPIAEDRRVAAILILPLALFALLTLESGHSRRSLQPARAAFDVHTDSRDLVRMDRQRVTRALRLRRGQRTKSPLVEANMSGRNAAVFGMYSTHDSAEAAVDTLRTKGFRTTDVSVLFPFVATLAGTAARTMSGATGVLIGLGIPMYHESRYEGRMRQGGVLLSVHADDREWASKGKQVLEQTGAEDICWTSEAE